jgi:hypothetical protein
VPDIPFLILACGLVAAMGIYIAILRREIRRLHHSRLRFAAISAIAGAFIYAYFLKRKGNAKVRK